MSADAAFFGMETPTAPASDFEVFEDNWPALLAFLRCGTQWRYAGMDGIRTGLDYAAVESVLRLTMAEEQRAGAFEGIQIMEHAALEVFHEKAARQRKTK